MKVIVQTIASTETAASLVVRESGNGKEIAVALNDIQQTVLLSDLRGTAPDIVHLGLSKAKGVFTYRSTDVRNSRTGLPYALEKNAGHCIGSVSCFGSVWVPEEGEPAVFFNGYVSVFIETDDEVIQLPPDTTSAEVAFMTYVPEAVEFVKKSQAKRNLLQKVNELDSLSSLEKQCDILSQILLSSDQDEISMLKDHLRECVAGASSIEGRDLTALAVKVNRQKRSVREAQAEYFDAIGEV